MDFSAASAAVQAVIAAVLVAGGLIGAAVCAMQFGILAWRWLRGAG